MNKLEVIVETLEDALSAWQGGATQLDLKAYYPCGGLTPTIGTVRTVSKEVEIPIIMMIRPTARSMQVSPGDLKIVCADIQAAMDLGVRDFLLGFLTSDSRLDVPAIGIIQKEAQGCRLHAHLAWELTINPWDALKQLIDMGFSSIRTGGISTSGTAIGGNASGSVETILIIKEIIHNQLEIFLAGGVNLENASRLIQSIGITNLHCGRGVRTPPTFEGAVDIEKVRSLRTAQLASV
jgi:copper homeostasis protein